MIGLMNVLFYGPANASLLRRNIAAIILELMALVFLVQGENDGFGFFTFIAIIFFLIGNNYKNSAIRIISSYPDVDQSRPLYDFHLMERLQGWNTDMDVSTLTRKELNSALIKKRFSFGWKVFSSMNSGGSKPSEGGGRASVTSSTASPTQKGTLWPECTQGGTITKWDGKNLEYQIRCTHCGDDQRPKDLNGGYVYNMPEPIRVEVNSEHDLNITYGYVCNICGRQSETHIRNGNR